MKASCGVSVDVFDINTNIYVPVHGKSDHCCRLSSALSVGKNFRTSVTLGNGAVRKCPKV